MADVVVIGAGVGGLTAAARLAALGHRVTIVERAETVGGKLGRLAVSGYTFDTGPSLLTLPQVFADLFAATGSTMESELDLVRLDPIVRHVFADGTMLDSCSDHEEFTARIATALGPTAADDWRRLWRRAGRIWDASWRHVLRSPMDSPSDLLRLAWRLPSLAAIAPGRTLRGLGRAYLRDPRLRQLLDRYATYAGSDPRRAPAALAAIPYAELTYGGWYLRGGLATLADALLARCTALGVRVELAAEVAAITTAGGAVTGVRLADGRTIAAALVISNVDASMTDGMVNRPTPAGDRSLGGFVVLLGLRGATPGQAHHTVYFPLEYDAEFDAVLPRHRQAQPADDPAVFVTVADDPGVHPDGHEAWFVLVNAAPHGLNRSTVDWNQPGLADLYADRILEVLARRGVDVRGRVEVRTVRTPADLERSTATPGGAIYGQPSHGMRGLLKPPNRGAVRGLFLVGGTTHPGGGLPMVALSGQIVADQIGPA